jgi:hypothetical protein
VEEFISQGVAVGERSDFKLDFDTVSRVCAVLGAKLVVEVV